MINRKELYPMNKNGVVLLKLVFSLVLGVIVASAMIVLMDTLLTADREQVLWHENKKYPMSSSTAEGLRAVRFHYALMALRQQADMVYVFGGRGYLAKQNGGWWGFPRWPLRQDCPWDQLQLALEAEGDEDWFRRLAGMGGTRFFEDPNPLLPLDYYEMDSGSTGFTILFLRGRVLLAVAQVRGWPGEGGDLDGWELWESQLVDIHELREWSYRCAWRKGEAPGGKEVREDEVPGEIRLPGAREFQVESGAPWGSMLAFAEVVFPDPLWRPKSTQDDEEWLPRYAYQFFFR